VRWAAILAVALASAAVQPGEASAEPAPRDVDRARDVYARAVEHHRQGRYREAARGYLAAFDLYPDPEFHFNAGQAFRLAGDGERAVTAYRKYLALDPDGRVSGDARRWIAEIEAQRPPPAPAAPAAQPTVVRIVTPGADDRTALRWTSAGIGAAGAVAIGGSVLFALQSRRIERRVESYDEWTVDRLAEIDDGRRAETLAWVLGAVGGAALVSGGVVAWFAWRPVSVSPQVDGDIVGVAVTGRF
jgi:tetratricopeptide (TPR) repeat protein